MSAEVNGRKQPQQERARRRRQQILDTSIEILQQDGLEKLNTASISEKLGISVGSLYRYFPNKQAILYTLAEQWLGANRASLEEIARWPLEAMEPKEFIERFLQKMADVYRAQRGLTLLLQTIMEVPELRELDEEHDRFVVQLLARMLKRLHVGSSRTERIRLSELLLNQGHFGLTLLVTLGPRLGSRTLEDLQAMQIALLQKHRQDNRT
ncbi:transcriptional regulator, TetR family [Microbulbifer donghaiensis]|uniref:Transcriptional regulator, TetR family n=1 Tax=Microbulbifer donghaiensis TaxID=494016 RepID=A0A1M4XXN1_9GAMM|nr:TetR/AcrR family transcriptional regulator [Microbulbifer donghaiensis]SHE98190.1 transcriptional regulator, TetR family [Microbulbifer donghaiensis]